MTKTKAVLLHLAKGRSARVSMDAYLWSLETPKGTAVPGKDSGYRGRSYVGTGKRELCRCISERSLSFDRAGLLSLLALPDSVPEMLAEVRSVGLATTLDKLQDRTEEMRSKLAADPGAPWIQETVTRLLPWERPKIRPCGDKLIISKYSHGGELASASLFPKTHAQVRRLGEDVYEHWRGWVLAKVLHGKTDRHAHPGCLRKRAARATSRRQKALGEASGIRSRSA
ncbi:hypothetical protein [Halovulum dunhuangense]|uniref:hypothetical protein n=1 Tax=Halovulum dunhuangense TaxID=1505036 RepID=UPI001FE2B571|nr:hypothetical protein [Halovulum dunhuangense]